MSTKRTKDAGQFRKGTSGNPAGRPPGSRNKVTLLMESLLDGEAEGLIRKAMKMALDGDIAAMRLCLERLQPPRKDRPIHLNLPRIQDVQQVAIAMNDLLTAVGDGQITANEGEVVANILAVQANVLSTVELERRVEELEQKAALNEQKP